MKNRDEFGLWSPHEADGKKEESENSEIMNFEKSDSSIVSKLVDYISSEENLGILAFSSLTKWREQ